MCRTRLLVVLLVALATGTTLAAAPRYFASLQADVDPLEVLQRRVDVLQMQLQELSKHAEPDDELAAQVVAPVTAAANRLVKI